MLKIRINNEEVVSNKDFTINEEMLNTSSVILNNVYPKTWENDKDYVSRFYHPNDYSKCLISDETDVPEEPGTTVEDTSFSINVDATKEYEFTSYKGQTTQSGTPTPTAPQPINVVSGRQDIVVEGKNLLTYAYDYGYSTTINGITWTINNDGTITANGTASSLSIFQFANANNLSSLIGKTIILNGTPSGINQEIYMGIYTSTYGVITNAYVGQDSSSVTINSTATRVLARVPRGATANNIVFKPMIRLATVSDNTYEAYKGNTYEINLGKNLAKLDTSYENTSNAVTCKVNEGQTITLTGTASANATFVIATGLDYPNATYTLSCEGLPTDSDRVRVRFRNTNGSYSDSGVNVAELQYNKLKTTVTRDINTVEILVLSGKTSNCTLKIQVEKGSQATTYVPYKTPIELCKIGTYQDRIFKSNGKNLANIENIQINRQWTGGYNSNRASILNIPIEPNTQYSIVGSWLNSHITQVRVVSFVNVGDSVPTGVFSGTFTSPQTDNYVSIEVIGDTALTSAMLEGLRVLLCKGSATMEDYEPYGTGWFIEKNIGKVVLNGTQNITLASSGVRRFNARYTALGLTNIKDGTGTYDTAQYRMCDHFRHSSSTYNAQKWGTYYTYNGWLVLYDTDTVIADANALKTWFTNNPTSIYYVLAIPTYTEITDSELISQLEGIKLLEGLNNIGISTPYLPMIMNLHYNYVIPRTDVDILFCGVVKNSGNISLNPRDPHYQTLQILSYKTFLSEGETLDFVIYQKTIKEAIEQVVGVIADYGFVVGNINLTNGDEVIGAYSTKDKTAYDVFNYLADITQSRWTTRLIDENTVAIDFYDPTLLPLGTAIDYTNECFESHTIDNMSYSYGSNDYRNKQVMTSQEVYSNISQTQSVIANGYQTQFNVEQKIGKINSIKIGSTSYTTATNQEKEMGVSADFYYTPGNNYFESATTIAVGTSITVEYIPIVEGRQIISNSTEIDRIANSTGVKGVIARYENRNDAITSQELQKIGQSYIKYKGVPEIILTVQTRSNLWNIGDRVPFNAPIDELKTEYMVKAKKINYITTIDTIFYTYELTSSFNSENAINYFDNQRAKATGNIGSGEYISRNIDIQSDANIIFYDTTATEIEIVGDNTLEAVLEAPFVS